MTLYCIACEYSQAAIANATNMGKSINLKPTSLNRLQLSVILTRSTHCALAFTIALANTTLPSLANPTSTPPPAITAPKPANSGLNASFNGKTMALPWHRWQSGKTWRIGAADIPLMENFGIELLDTSSTTAQPWRWFSNTSGKAAAKFVNPYRYIDLTELAKAAGWKLQIIGNILQITAPSAQIKDIEVPDAPEPVPPPATDTLEPEAPPVVYLPQPQKFTIALDKPTPWKISQQKGGSVLTIWGTPSPEVSAKFAPTVPVLEAGVPQPLEVEDTNVNPTPTPSPAIPNTSNLPQLKAVEDRTEIRFNVPSGWQTQVTSLSNPHRLVVDIAPDAFKPKSIQWLKGIKWQQKYLSLGSDKFAVTWLEINPKQVTIKPIWSNPKSLVGTASLGKTATLWKAVAAINAGFFNRNLVVPLGVLRRDRQWLSSPILNRGAIAWNDKGDFKIAKAVWKETLTIQTGESLPVVQLNSGFIEPGISRYTAAWGTTYTPLTNNETILVVESDRISNQLTAPLAGQNPINIPVKGYLLTIRAQTAALPPIGTQIRLNTQIAPADFNRYPQIIGAGPLLIQNRQIVLNGAAEGFKEPFMKQTAIRSAIATNSSGQVLLIAVHNRAGGAGATLTELAQLVQQMGAKDALNLDGGSSTSLYLGGQLIDRSPATAARVHNAIGIFALQNR